MNNNAHPDQNARQERSMRLLRLVLIPLFFCIVAAALIAAIVFSKPAVPASSLGKESAKQSVLTNFTDDLGSTSELKFTTVELSHADLAKGSLVLVNGKTAWSFPSDNALVNVYDNAVTVFQLSGTNLLLQEPAMDAFNAMMSEFVRITGYYNVMLSECYRSEEEQVAVYKQALDYYGDSAGQYAAKPGHSECHTGYAIGLSLYENDTVKNFTGTDDCEWLLRNSYRFGYILRYPEGKTEITGYAPLSHHFRYVGKPHAYLMRLKNYCLEEYLDYVSHYTFGGNHIQITDNENQSYEIYYVPAEETITNVPVPLEKEYSISGDNHSGFIVTVTL